MLSQRISSSRPQTTQTRKRNTHVNLHQVRMYSCPSIRMFSRAPFRRFAVPVFLTCFAVCSFAQAPPMGDTPPSAPAKSSTAPSVDAAQVEAAAGQNNLVFTDGVAAESALPDKVPAQHTAPATPQLVDPSPLQVEIAQAHAWQLITTTFKSPKPSLRVESLNALSMIPGNARARDMVESALSDAAAEVRVQAAALLAQMNDTTAVPKIKPLLKDKSPEVMFAAARALSQLGDPSGRDILVEVLAGDRRVSGGMMDAGKDWARQFTYKDAVFLGAAEGASVFTGPFGAIGISALRQVFFQDHTSTSRATSAQALAPDGSDRVIDILENALKDKDWTVRFSAANALGAAPRKQPIPHLMNMLRDKKLAVRLVSAASIVRLATPPATSQQTVSLQGSAPTP